MLCSKREGNFRCVFLGFVYEVVSGEGDDSFFFLLFKLKMPKMVLSNI